MRSVAACASSFAFFLLFLSAPAFAVPISIGLKGGVSTYSVQAGTTYAGSTDLGFDFRPQINFDWDQVNLALDFFFQGRIGSAIGAFPLSRFGTGVYYYPLGLGLYRSILDNGVTVTQNRLAPFITGQVLFASVAITDISDTTNPVSFNALSVNFQLGGGLEFPVGENFSLIAELIYERTLMGGSTASSDSSSSSGIVVEGFNGLIGITIHP